LTKIKPFKAIRPTRDKAYLVSTRPFYDYKKNALEAKLEHNPFTFLHVINPEFHKDDKTEPNSPERYQKSRDMLESFILDGIFIQEEKEALYLYRQSKGNNSYLGLIGGASVDQYNNGHIKKHEATITAREKKFSDYLKIVKCNAEPVLLFHERNTKLNIIFEQIISARSEYEFSTSQGIVHEVWVIENPVDIQKIQECYKEIEDVYIADGHHRCASSARFSKEVGASMDSLENHFLAYFISEQRMEILDYNRLVSDLNGHTVDSLLNEIEKSFEIEQINSTSSGPSELHQILMYIDKSWYKLTAKEDSYDASDPVSSLDTDILTKNILSPILGINDLKTDERITFINGKKGMIGIQEVIDSGSAIVGFGLFPVSVEQLKAVADNDMIMPPKSTWIEPKMRSGLTMYPLEAND
jgi:uncharacterized protein (DUF1015 family)